MDLAERGRSRIYDGQIDELMADTGRHDRLIIVPDGRPSSQPDASPRMRIMWGQYLLDDLIAGRYRSLVCAVNATDNSRGIVGHIATILPTSQWTAASITEYAGRFADRGRFSVLKFDLDSLEILALLRPPGADHLSLDQVAAGFTIVSEMIRRKPQRLPVASVSFLGARENQLRDETGQEPSFETVLRIMHESGFTGDVYPAPWMWNCAPTAVYARYPFPDSVQRLREGGF
ncbi:MAG: hypothetical protein IT442_00330 [Phycisphaeraceae bacterium]|nr:hypothetical protein [Phycisphaeraceae bacterium]